MQVFDTVDLHFMREARELTASLAIPNITRAFDLVEWMDLKAPALAEVGEVAGAVGGWVAGRCVGLEGERVCVWWWVGVAGPQLPILPWRMWRCVSVTV